MQVYSGHSFKVQRAISSQEAVGGAGGRAPGNCAITPRTYGQTIAIIINRYTFNDRAFKRSDTIAAADVVQF